MKNKYDTSVIFLYAIGREHLLPHDCRKKIPYSTISTWRHTNYGNYLGHEFRYHFNDAFKSFELQQKNTQLRITLRSLARSWLTLSNIILPMVKKANNNKKAQGKILKAVDYLKQQFGLDKTLKLLGLSKPLYYQWVLEARFDCFDSYTQLCVRRHPQQLETKEIPECDLKLQLPVSGKTVKLRLMTRKIEKQIQTEFNQTLKSTLSSKGALLIGSRDQF